MDSLNIYHLLVAFFETYIFNDWNVLTSLMVLVAIDTGTGIHPAEVHQAGIDQGQEPLLEGILLAL